MKNLLFAAGFLLLARATWADGTQATFKEVRGTVQVRHGEKWIDARKDLTVVEGQQIQTQENSSAVLGLFDGSELTISAKTQFTLTALKQPDADSKVIKFKLLWGQLEALVKKLTTASSSFEIESGGVVCGVRGTRFSMSNNGAPKPQVVVQVTNGSVYTIDGVGHHFVVQAGNQMKFLNGAKVGGGSFDHNNPNYKKSGNTTGGSNGSSSNGTGSGSSTNASGNGGPNPVGATGNSPTGNGDTNAGSNPTGGNNPVGGASTGNGAGAPPSAAPPAPNAPGVTAPGGGLADLNNQFQSSTLINTQNTITNPTVQQALQLNVQLQVGR